MSNISRNDYEKLKAELKSEILAELGHEMKSKKGIDFDYDEYKVEVVKKDMLRIKTWLDQGVKFHWYLPIIGIYIFTYQQSLQLANIDRGLLKRNQIRASLRLWPYYVYFGLIGWLEFLIFPFSYIFVTRKILYRALEFTDDELFINSKNNK